MDGSGYLGESEFASQNRAQSGVTHHRLIRSANCNIASCLVGWFCDVHPLSACMRYADCTVETSHPQKCVTPTPYVVRVVCP